MSSVITTIFGKNIKKALILIFSLACCLSVILHGCSFLPKTQLQPLKIGITSWPGFDIILYGETAGIFKKRGLEVELVRFENQQDSTRAVMRGSLDGAFTSLWDGVTVDSGEDKPEVLLVTNISAGADGIVSQEPIKKVAELKGKKIGAKLNTVNHLILLEALNKYNLSAKDVKIEDISNETAAKLIEDKKLDAAVIWQPLLGETAKKIGGNIIYTTKEVDSLIIDIFLTRSNNVNSKKAEWIQFLSTWLDIMYAVDTKPQEVYSQVAQKLKQLPIAFANDYNGLKKGDLEMQKRMFQKQSRLDEAIEEMGKLLESDPRSGRSLRKDIEINKELITTAIEGWKS